MMARVAFVVFEQVAGLKRSAVYGAIVPAQYAKSLPRALVQIWEKEGLRGIYKGVVPSILKAAPQAAVTLTAYHFLLVAMSLIPSAGATVGSDKSQTPPGS